MKKRLYLFMSLILVLILYFSPSIIGGYSYSEGVALRKSYPNISGEVVFEKEFGDKKVIVLKAGNVSYAKLIDKYWDVLNRVTNVSSIHSRDPNIKMKKTWSAHLNDNNRYDTLFAVETTDPTIKKIIVSNEGFNQNLTTLEEVKKYSVLYQEMDIVNGYTAHYLNLAPSETGNFVFRGLNEEGEIVMVDW